MLQEIFSKNCDWDLKNYKGGSLIFFRATEIFIKLRKTVSYFCFDKGLRIVIVELSKFKKKTPATLLDLREEWCYLLKESKKMGERESKELSAKGLEMEEAMFHLKELSREEGLRLVEEARDKAWKDQMAREDDSFNRGIEQGKVEGVEKGKTEERRNLIISMLKNGMEASFISKITDFSKEEIRKLKKSLS